MNRAQMTTSHTSRKAPAASRQKASATSEPARKRAARESDEKLLARVEAVRLAQRQEGHFDCFAKAKDGYCDQGGCAYHADCLSISQRLA